MNNPYRPPASNLEQPVSPAGKVPRLALAFWTWVLISIVATIGSAMTGEYWSLMSQAVESAGIPADDAVYETMVWGFIIISMVVFVASVIVGALLVWRTNKGNLWAKYLLTLFAAFQLYMMASTAITIHADYTYTYGPEDWVLTPIAVLLLLYVGISPYFANRSSARSVA